MDLNLALQKHTEWKTRFRNALHAGERLDAERFALDTSCELGRWLHGKAYDLYRERSDFRYCIMMHAALHREIGRLALVVNSGDRDSMLMLLLPEAEFAVATRRVVHSIRLLMEGLNSSDL